MVLDLTTNELQPLLGALSSIFEFREASLKTDDLIVNFTSHEIDTLLCLTLRSGHASFNLNLDTFDARIGFGFDLIDPAGGVGQLVLQATNLVPRRSVQAGDALVCLLNCPMDASISIGLYLFDGGVGFFHRPVEKPIGLLLELIYPILGLPQLTRKLMR
jgi:hypothetical protein